MLKHYGHWGDFLHKNVKNLTRTLMNDSCEQSKSVGSILYMVRIKEIGHWFLSLFYSLSIQCEIELFEYIC